MTDGYELENSKFVSPRVFRSSCNQSTCLEKRLIGFRVVKKFFFGIVRDYLREREREGESRTRRFRGKRTFLKLWKWEANADNSRIKVNISWFVFERKNEETENVFRERETTNPHSTFQTTKFRRGWKFLFKIISFCLSQVQCCSFFYQFHQKPLGLRGGCVCKNYGGDSNINNRWFSTLWYGSNETSNSIQYFRWININF